MNASSCSLADSRSIIAYNENSDPTLRSVEARTYAALGETISGEMREGACDREKDLPALKVGEVKEVDVF